MTWQSIETAPKDGRPVLLWARLRSHPPSEDDFHRIVGFWHRAIGRWKVSPEELNGQEDLIAVLWSALPEPPTNN
jgi:hypothetical protein